jgi:hypothetical protein
MSEIRILPLGAGQDVGRSCILITMGGKNIMLDCGLHMGFHDDVCQSFCLTLLYRIFSCSVAFPIFPSFVKMVQSHHTFIV